MIEEVGVDRIRERSLALTELLIDLLDAAGFEIASPREPERAAAPSSCARRTTPPCTASSASAGSSATSGPTPASGSARTSTTPRTELRHTVAQLAEIVASGAYERHAGAAARF